VRGRSGSVPDGAPARPRLAAGRAAGATTARILPPGHRQSVDPVSPDHGGGARSRRHLVYQHGFAGLVAAGIVRPGGRAAHPATNPSGRAASVGAVVARFENAPPVACGAAPVTTAVGVG